MAAICKGVGQLTGFGGFGFEASKLPSVSATRRSSQLVKSNGKHLFLVDTLALVIYIPFSSFRFYSFISLFIHSCFNLFVFFFFFHLG